MRQTLCEINLDAVRHNVRTLIDHVAPTPVCAVVKANGYGHGSVEVAKAALDAGAQWLAVALAEEGVALRDAGITAPVLVLSEQGPSSTSDLIEHDLIPSVNTPEGIDRLGDHLSTMGSDPSVDRAPIDVHLVLDTGMRRVGAEPDQLDALSERIAAYPSLSLAAVWTHCPVADEPDNPFTSSQLERFDAATPPALATHVGNSAVAIDRPDREAAMVRCGIAVYGIDPDEALAGRVDLQPVMTIRSVVSFAKTIPAGASVGYGHRWTASTKTNLVTVPIGYADGIRRDLGLRGGEVLIGGKRFPIVGVVTMDQLMVDVGDAQVAIGDDVVLVGRQGDEQITAAEVAAKLDTIPYEIVCAVSERVPRVYI